MSSSLSSSPVSSASSQTSSPAPPLTTHAPAHHPPAAILLPVPLTPIHTRDAAAALPLSTTQQPPRVLAPAAAATPNTGPSGLLLPVTTPNPSFKRRRSSTNYGSNAGKKYVRWTDEQVERLLRHVPFDAASPSLEACEAIKARVFPHDDDVTPKRLFGKICNMRAAQRRSEGKSNNGVIEI